MKYRTLGTTGIKVSEVCLGTMTFGRQNSEAEGHAQMDRAVEAGINFFDTAELYAVPPNEDTYGKTERILGSWFSSRGSRKDIILATKMCGAGPKWIRGGAPITRENIHQAVSGSLERLGTDYIDLYQLHWPNRGSYHFGQVWNYRGGEGETATVISELLETLETLGEYVNKGVIRHIGLSNETAWGVMKYLDLAERNTLPRIVSIQNEYSLVNRLFEPELSEVSLRENVGLLAWSPLATGLLTGKYRNGNRPDGTRWTIGKNHRDTPQAHEAVEAYQKIADRHGLSLVELALSFATSRPFVTSNIIGATSVKQLDENIAACAAELPESALEEINTVRKTIAPAY